ncbi:hypothetical protein B2G71_09455 [Novosphingobium sp. PC22D]|uniref:hypothetical protein n=1 Tax=Novosphingobium sp. PC22D TaxID=1962403 RepID=UPI000BF09599|nr:hypothetical protein [Novosphingobium sp. PC22D]PEQ13040.1 hypothetical protein B2G71_09455 [Novosphingobium sp. PC22D]
MGNVVRFKRPPRNQGQFKGYRPSPGPDGPKKPKKPKRKWGLLHSLVTLIGGAVALHAIASLFPA